MNNNLSPIRIAAIYAIFGAMWIVFSDTALHSLVRDAEVEASLQTAKGWFYVLVTGGLVFWLASRMMTQITTETAERRRSDEQFRATFEQAAVGIAHVAPDGTFLRVNRRFAEIAGHPYETLLKGAFQSITHPDDLDRDIALVHRLKAGELDTYAVEKRYIRADGGTVWVNLTVSAVRHPDGSPAYFVSVIEDISESKRAEAALRDSEERFYLALENIPDVVVIYDADHRIQFVNSASRRLAGLEAKALIGKRDEDVFPQEICRHYLPTVRKAFASGETCEVETTLALSPNDTRRLRITCVPILDQEGDVREVVGITHDLTEQRAMEASLRQAQKMEAVGQLTGGLAHDLNNVLNVISANVELLRFVAPEDTRVDKHVEAALGGIRRAGRLTRRLLDFSRTETGETQRVVLNTFVTGLQGLLAKSLTPAINLQIEQSGDGWMVEVNPGDFEAALLNLAINARDAMPDGGTLVIETANKVLDSHYVARNPDSSSGAFVMVSVSDTGTGMAPEVAERAFDPFFTTKEVGKGTGLGLSMVYGFVRRSGGHVKIYSEPGEGTTVRMYLPRARGTPEDELRPDRDAPALPGGDETVLIVDDEPDLVEAAVAILGKLGYRPLGAGDAAEAMAILRREPTVHLLFSDVIMPGGMDGYRLAVAATNERPGLRVLLTSGFTRRREEFVDGERELAADLAKNLLPKPYNVNELALAVRRALDREA